MKTAWKYIAQLCSECEYGWEKLIRTIKRLEKFVIQTYKTSHHLYS
jgi:hypothetical protein